MASALSGLSGLSGIFGRPDEDAAYLFLGLDLFQSAELFMADRTPFANPTAPFSSWGNSNGTDTGGNYRIKHVAARKGLDPQFIYTNFSANNVTVRAAIEYSGVYYPIWFRGKRDIVIEPNALVVSDPAAITLAAGLTFYSRTFIQVTSGNVWRNNMYPHLEDQRSRSNGESDLTLGGATSYALEYLYAPSGILAAAPEGEIAKGVVALGDSIANGQNDTYFDGWIVAAAAANGAGCVRATYNATQVYYFNDLAAAFQYPQKLLSSCARRVISHYGHNDVSAGVFATLQSSLQAAWNIFHQRGVKVYQATLLPRCTSTDSFATLVNQTPASGHENGETRTLINDWIRTSPSPLTGYIEAADAVESARNSGLWKVNYTADGVHPLAVAHAAIAAAVPASVFG